MYLTTTKNKKCVLFFSKLLKKKIFINYVLERCFVFFLVIKKKNLQFLLNSIKVK
jgi:hypothetical protein